MGVKPDREIGTSRVRRRAGRASRCDRCRDLCPSRQANHTDRLSPMPCSPGVRRTRALARTSAHTHACMGSTVCELDGPMLISLPDNRPQSGVRLRLMQRAGERCDARATCMYHLRLPVTLQSRCRIPAAFAETRLHSRRLDMTLAEHHRRVLELALPTGATGSSTVKKTATTKVKRCLRIAHSTHQNEKPERHRDHLLIGGWSNSLQTRCCSR